MRICQIKNKAAHAYLHGPLCTIVPTEFLQTAQDYHLSLKNLKVGSFSLSKSKEVITTKKTLEQLRQEYAEAEAKLHQEQRRAARLENRIRDYQQQKRKERTHNLITKGAAIESIMPQTRDMSERAFYELMETVFSMPEVARLIRAAAPQEGGD